MNTVRHYLLYLRVLDIIAESSELRMFLLAIIINIPLPNNTDNVTYFDFCRVEIKFLNITWNEVKCGIVKGGGEMILYVKGV